jgi:hypothetical protein
MAVKPLDPKTADKRTAERYMRNGLLDAKAYERHLGELPDVAAKATAVETRMLDAELDDEDEDDMDEEDDASEGADEE